MFAGPARDAVARQVVSAPPGSAARRAGTLAPPLRRRPGAGRRAGRARAGLGQPVQRPRRLRAPAGRDFGAPQVFEGASSEPPALVLRPDGSARDRLRQGPTEPLRAFLRSRARAVRPAAASPAREFRARANRLRQLGLVRPGSVPVRSAAVTAALGADGRALIVSPTDESGFGVATLTSAGAASRRCSAARCATRSALTPLVLADGTRAIAWSDNRDQTRRRRAAPRLHYAVEGAANAPAAPRRRSRVLAPRRRALRPAQSLVLPVRAARRATCALRCPGARPRRTSRRRSRAPGRRSCASARGPTSIVPKRGPLRVTVRSGPPGARTAHDQTFKVRLRRLPAPPLPHILNLRARRIGDDIEVRWDTEFPARDAYFVAFGTRTRDRSKDRDAVVGVPRGKGRHLRVRLKDAARVRYVTVELSPVRRKLRAHSDDPRRIGSVHAAVKRVTTEHECPAQQPRAAAADAAAPPRAQPRRARPHARL